MGFTLKKLLSILLNPLMAGLVLLVIAVCRRRHKDAWYFGLAAVLLVFGSALPVVQQLLAAPLEAGLRPHQQLRGELAPYAIVVLSGAYEATPDRQLWDEMNVSTLRRTLEGIRLARMYPNALLYMSGGDPWQKAPPARAMAELAVHSGIDAKRLRIERHSRDTADQAIALAPALRGGPFLLVTSAYHMPRSMALFHAAGVRPIAAPTDFITSAHYDFALKDLIPNDAALAGTEAAIHEYVGSLWSHVRGQR